VRGWGNATPIDYTLSQCKMRVPSVINIHGKLNHISLYHLVILSNLSVQCSLPGL